jgi:hypothetical protein
MTRTLYLGTEAQRVVLDGPALRVGAADQADRQVPLRLLSRVVARPNAEWSTAALVACLGAGIPITFLRPDGMPLGHCLPAGPRSSDLVRLIDRFEGDWDALSLFGNWVRAEERRAILRLTRRSAAAHHGAELRPERLRDAILDAAGPAQRASAAALLLGLEGLLGAHLPRLLLEAGLSPRWATPAPEGRLDLFGACFAALRWSLIPMLDDALRHRNAHPDAWGKAHQRNQRLARRYEGSAAAIATLVRAMLHRLELLLWERASGR